MPYCPKCGTKVSEETSFCPKCGTALKIERAPAPAAPPAPYRSEKAEKREKEEKEMWREKKEKREYGYIGPLIGGFILIALGLMFFLAITWGREVAWAFFLVIIGIIVIVGAVYAAMIAARRHPQT